MNTKNNQVEKGQPDLSRQTVNNSRRSFARLGVAAPVIMTLASKPVFAFQGLSNMLSTHGSAACRGDNRYGGMSPGFWKDPNGATQLGDNGHAAWDLTGHVYGDLPLSFAPKGKSDAKWDDYTAGSGTHYSTVFGSGYTGESLREVLNKYESDAGDGIKPFHLIAGYLNARYFDAKAGIGGTTQYIFTEAQFWKMYNNISPYSRIQLAQLCSSAYYDQGPHNCS